MISATPHGPEPKEIEMSVKARLKSLLRSCGYDLRRIPDRYDLHVNAFYDQTQLLARSNVRVIFDLGAHIGETAEEYGRWFPDTGIYSFEPSSDSFRILRQTAGSMANVQAFALAVSDRTGDAPLYTYHAASSNSLLPIAVEARTHVKAALLEEDQTEIVKTTTLDEFCSDHHIGQINILKMDIQGGELRALRGARKLLCSEAIDLIYSEVLFSKLYQGQAEFCEIRGFLAGYGYELFGVYNLNHGQNAVLAWGDAIFLNPNLFASWIEQVSVPGPRSL